MGEVILPTGAEVDVPATKTAHKGFRILVVGGAEPTSLAWIRLRISHNRRKGININSMRKCCLFPCANIRKIVIFYA